MHLLQQALHNGCPAWHKQGWIPRPLPLSKLGDTFGSSLLARVLVHFLAQHPSGTVARHRLFVLRDLLLHSASYINAQYNVGKGESALPSQVIQKALEAAAPAAATAVSGYCSTIQPPVSKCLLAFFCGELSPATLLCGR
ncbi:hypothetical protein EK904_009429 [Melospiza melodia maxima]|nr:hypothetical protein EK904_009429 [Melospiza melodia maxima]